MIADATAADALRSGASLVEIIAGPGPAATATATLVVRVAPYATAPAGREARVGIAIADPALAQAVSDAVTAAIAAAVAETFAGVRATAAGGTEAATADRDVGTEPRVEGQPGSGPAREPDHRAPMVRVRSRAGLARAGDVAGAIAIVPVTARNARHLVELVDQLRAAGAAGVQLVWDGLTPPRDHAERHVFAVLERARATPAGPPVVVATAEPVVAALHLLVAHRNAHRSRTLPKDEPR